MCKTGAGTGFQLWEDADNTTCTWRVLQSVEIQCRKKHLRNNLLCCPSPFLFSSVCHDLCLELSDISHSALPPLIAPCVISDSPSSGILQHSRLDFLSPLLSDGQITEVVSSTLLLHLPPPFLSSQPVCVCVCVLRYTNALSSSATHTETLI